jgi:tight adherence protein C
MLVALIIFVAVVVLALLVLGILNRRNPALFAEEDAAARLAEYAAAGQEVTLERIELSQPFAQRVIYPIARGVGAFLARLTPQSIQNSLTEQLEHAGLIGRVNPSLIFFASFLTALLCGGLLGVVTSLSPNFSPLLRVVFIVAGLFLGFYLPRVWLSRQVSQRQKAIRKAMPDALDLLTVCVEAGLGFDAAMGRVAEKWRNPLSEAFGRSLREMQLGKSRRDALRDMAANIGIPEMTSFIAAIIQSEQLGVSISRVLRIQSNQMRQFRRQRAEEQAHQAPVKMLLPMALLILPSLFIVIMTPAVLGIINSGVLSSIGMP